jgi:hypothetical protein
VSEFKNVLLKFNEYSQYLIETKFTLSRVPFIVTELSVQICYLISLLLPIGWFQTAANVRQIAGVDPSSS